MLPDGTIFKDILSCRGESVMEYDCLIIDDEVALAENTTEYFNIFDIKTAFVTSWEMCMDFLNENNTRLILLDINLGSSCGFDLCKQLRQTTDIPILFISARQGDDDQIIALNIGGDDYIQKPYSLGVLLAKVKAVLKRYSGNDHEIFVCSNLKIDFTLHRVYIRNREVPLKAMEYKLLSYLVKNKKRIIGKEEIFKNVWEDTITSDNTLNVHIRHLREKIETNPDDPVFIRTVWGRGYIFEVVGQ